MSGLVDNQQKPINEKEKWKQEEWIGITPSKRDLPVECHPVLFSQNPAERNTDHRKPPFANIWEGSIKVVLKTAVHSVILTVNSMLSFLIVGIYKKPSKGQKAHINLQGFENLESLVVQRIKIAILD